MAGGARSSQMRSDNGVPAGGTTGSRKKNAILFDVHNKGGHDKEKIQNGFLLEQIDDSNTDKDGSLIADNMNDICT